MARADGFATADHDTAFLRDPRVVRIARQLGLAGLAAYLAVRDASWAEGERVPLEEVVDGLPGAYGVDIDEVGPALVEVGLLDADGRIPSPTWDAWFGPARDRRAARRESGRLGGLTASLKHRSSDAVATLEEGSGDAVPVRTVSSVSSDRSVRRGPAVATPPNSSRVDCRKPDEHTSTSWHKKPIGTYRVDEPGWYCELCVAEDADKGPAFRERVPWPPG